MMHEYDNTSKLFFIATPSGHCLLYSIKKIPIFLIILCSLLCLTNVGQQQEEKVSSKKFLPSQPYSRKNCFVSNTYPTIM